MFEVTFEDVKRAWDEWNSLTKPWCGEGGRGGAPDFMYKDREVAWRRYTKVRDLFLYKHHLLTVPTAVLAHFDS